MPHKHTRKGANPTDYELPPTQIAKPLPVAPNRGQRQLKTPQSKLKGTKRRRAAASQCDDAPRAFRRLMAFAKGKTPRSGLDDGKEKSSTDQTKKSADGIPAVPAIRPGEHLSDYSARVDAALPVSGLVTKTAKQGKDPLGLKAHKTRKEKKMHKLYDQWRVEDQKIKERKEEALELEAEREIEDGTLMLNSGVNVDEGANPTGSGGKKRKRRRKGHGSKEEDPWEELRRKRGEDKLGLGDVAKAPPVLQKVDAKLITRA